MWYWIFSFILYSFRWAREASVSYCLGVAYFKICRFCFPKRALKVAFIRFKCHNQTFLTKILEFELCFVCFKNRNDNSRMDVPCGASRSKCLLKPTILILFTSTGSSRFVCRGWNYYCSVSVCQQASCGRASGWGEGIRANGVDTGQFSATCALLSGPCRRHSPRSSASFGFDNFLSGAPNYAIVERKRTGRTI